MDPSESDRALDPGGNVETNTDHPSKPGPIVLKLGGSVITDKSARETIDDRTLDRAAEAIGAALDTGTIPTGGDPGGLILVHGGGSFGHAHAAEQGVSTTAGTRDPEAVRTIHGAMKRLNGVVLDRLAAVGVPALPVHPLSAGRRTEDGELQFSTTAVRGMLGEGFVPVLHGDVLAQRRAGATIVSGDEVLTHLAAALRADRVGLCSTVPGVLDDDGAVIDRIDSLRGVEQSLGGSETTDVTGGMAGKVRTLLALDAPASVFGLDGLGGFLDGDSPGTLVSGPTDGN